MNPDNIANGITSPQSRREFLKRAGLLAAAGAATPWALDLAALSAAPTVNAATSDGYRALVCVFLYGGNDHHDTIVPYDTASYNSYASLRGALARPRNTLLALGNPNVTTGRQLAFTPDLATLKPVFDAGELAVVANVGTLREPLDRAAYFANPQRRPPQLFSHNDQQSMWQSSVGEGATSGWGGRLADLLLDGNAGQSVFTCISAAGNAVMLTGREAVQLQVSTSGVTKLFTNISSSQRSNFLTALNDVMAFDDAAMFPTTYTTVAKRSIDTSARLETSLSAAGATTTPFPTSSLGKQLAMVARLITAGRNHLGVKRQVFFVSTGGFDTHDSLATVHPGLIANLSESLAAFRAELIARGANNDVCTFTGSDFGRTLSINGDGSDHAWGSHHLVMGGRVNGGSVYGSPPAIGVNTADDVGAGRLIPTTAVDQYASTMARWMGAGTSELALVLPNVNRFATSDVGFLSAAAPIVPVVVVPPTVPVTTPVPPPTTPPTTVTPTPTATPPKRLSGQHVALTPRRVVDTRNGVGGRRQPLGPSSNTTFDMTATAGLDIRNVSAISVNIVAVGATEPTYLTFSALPASSAPATSTINVGPGRARSNATVLPVAADGSVNVYNETGDVDIIVDVTGYFTSEVLAPSTPSSLLTPLDPTRLCDTRNGLGAAPGRLGAASTMTVAVAGSAGVPRSATAAVLNVTVVSPTEAGFLAVWPSGEPRPDASSINFVAGEVVANMVEAKLGADGNISIYNHAGDVDVIVDVVAYYSTDGYTYTPLTPIRAVDTRRGLGAPKRKVAAASVTRVACAGHNGVPRTAKAVLANIVSVAGSQPTFFTVYPTGSPLSDTSSLNAAAGAVVANTVVAKLGTDGKIDIFNQAGNTDLIVDIYGYFT